MPFIGDQEIEPPTAVTEDVAGEREAAGLGRRLEKRLAAGLRLFPAAELVEDLQSPEERRPVGAPVLRPFQPGRELEKLAAAPARLVDALVEFVAGLLESPGGLVEEIARAALEKLGDLFLQSSGARDQLERLPHAVVRVRRAGERFEDPERDRPQALATRQRAGLRKLRSLFVRLRDRRQTHREDTVTGDQRSDERVVGVGAHQEAGQVLGEPCAFLNGQEQRGQTPRQPDRP